MTHDDFVNEKLFERNFMVESLNGIDDWMNSLTMSLLNMGQDAKLYKRQKIADFKILKFFHPIFTAPHYISNYYFPVTCPPYPLPLLFIQKAFMQNISCR